METVGGAHWEGLTGEQVYSGPVFSLQQESSDVLRPVGQTFLYYLFTLFFIFYCSVWIGKIPGGMASPLSIFV